MIIGIVGRQILCKFNQFIFFFEFGERIFLQVDGIFQGIYSVLELGIFDGVLAGVTDLVGQLLFLVL